jgi:hypothetical protein
LEPIAARVLPPAARADLSFDAFFEHILAHELSHDIGPHQIQAGGRSTNARQELKELYSAIEEAKAERRLYTTFLASAFRSLRFGLTDAHGKGMALQAEGNYAGARKMLDGLGVVR